MTKKKRYSNPYIQEIRRGAKDFLLWITGYYDDILPIAKPPANFIYPAQEIDLDPSKPIVTWINHCTFLLQIEGVSILTDPIWSERCSPISFVGPKRRHQPPIAIEELDSVDFVVISHNHYDHLDEKSVRLLHSHFPSIEWVVPKGVKAWFTRRGITRVSELDWWESKSYNMPDKKITLRVTGVPVQHHSGRGLFDADTSLWMGCVLEAIYRNKESKKAYFVGDTAYNEYDFKKIGKAFKGIDLSLCPIGAYTPSRFMRTVHASPDDAVKIHRDVQAKLSIGMHWKTFCLADEDIEQPPYDLYKAMKRHGLCPTTFIPLEPGEKSNW